ncbi:MAG: CBS domain-containing protein [Chloroflexi bacterium]|nr:CBS domain-containing protein [Chloroflexota bacterium]
MPNTFRLGEIAGVPVLVHYTWPFAFVLITWSLAQGFFPEAFGGWDALAYWVAGAIAALALFGSVLVHEFSHSLVAMARGLGVHSITLFIFGGMSRIEEEAERPYDEFIISIVGPVTSFVLAGVFWVVLQVVSPGPTPLGGILVYLAIVNVLLGGFNLVPGFPLDGGRVLRSFIWAATNNVQRATDISSYVGQGLGLLLVILGVLQLFGGNLLGGLWLIFIGWFLNSGAEGSRQQLELRESLQGVRAADLMNPRPTTASPEMSTEEFVHDHVIRQGIRAMPVMEDSRLVGIVSITDAKQVPAQSWPSIPVGEIMTRAPLKTVSPGTGMQRAINLLADGGLNQLPVTEGERLVGLLSRSEVVGFLELRGQLGLGSQKGLVADKLKAD